MRLKVKKTCTKPKCKHWHKGPPQRHHMRSEKQFIRAFRRHVSKDKYKRFTNRLVRRYKAFRERDLVLLCEWHHSEIHFIYNKVIHIWLRAYGLDLYRLTPRQAVELMRELKKVCQDWLTYESPGQHPSFLKRRNTRHLAARRW